MDRDIQCWPLASTCAYIDKYTWTHACTWIHRTHTVTYTHNATVVFIAVSLLPMKFCKSFWTYGKVQFCFVFFLNTDYIHSPNIKIQYISNQAELLVSILVSDHSRHFPCMHIPWVIWKAYGAWGSSPWCVTVYSKQVFALPSLCPP